MTTWPISLSEYLALRPALRRLTDFQYQLLALGTLNPTPTWSETPAEARARAVSGFCGLCQLEGEPVKREDVEAEQALQGRSAE